VKIVESYLHGCKESAYDIQKDMGLTDEQRDNLVTALYEVQFEIDVDTGDILSVDGKKFGKGETP
jgi:hypothetical protein